MVFESLKIYRAKRFNLFFFNMIINITNLLLKIDYGIGRVYFSLCALMAVCGVRTDLSFLH